MASYSVIIYKSYCLQKTVNDLMRIEHRIGPSSCYAPETSVFDAALKTKRAGFKAFEIHLDDFSGEIGKPWLVNYAGVWPRTFDEERRKKLKKELQGFSIVIVHGTPYEVNIATQNICVGPLKYISVLPCFSVPPPVGNTRPWHTSHLPYKYVMWGTPRLLQTDSDESTTMRIQTRNGS